MFCYQYLLFFCQNALFGKGIYLSSEISVSLPYSPTGHGWGKSVVGTQLSCIAVCELVDHPDVKCQVKGITQLLHIFIQSCTCIFSSCYFNKNNIIFD